MAEPRKATQQKNECSFCGTHKMDVPLIVTSSLEKAACCSDCALGIVQQTQRWAYGIFATAIAEKERAKAAEKKIIVAGDTTNGAINKVQS